jgi:GAF domain/ANTAR domain
VTSDRLSVVLAAMADGGRAGTGSLISRVCGAAVELLSLSGAGISLMADGELRGTAGVSERGIAVVQELELTLGEGPCIDAWESMEPVVESDLERPARVRWPAFAQACERSAVRAVFALPLHLGAIGIGVLVLYRDRSGGLSEEELALGLVLSDVATQVVLGLQAGAAPEELHELLAREPAHWAEVHQATGMVSAQLGVPLDEAFVRLRAHAFADGRALREIAYEVLARRLRLAEEL